MIFRPFYYFDSGCAAYVLGCAGKGYAAVVDPQEWDLDNYVDFSTAKGMCITHVIDTHIHADHVSGGRKLAERTGALYCLHESAQVAFPFAALRSGQEIPIGNVAAKVLHTPGHTPESICLLISDSTRSREPWFLLTGDTLFVGSVGRPDLADQIEQDARVLYRSIQSQIRSLPDNVEVYPAHFSGSVCGKGMSGKPMSTLGYEKRFNPMLCSPSEEGFLTVIAGTILPEPANKTEIIRRNQGNA